MLATKNGHIDTKYFYFNKIIKGPGTSFQSLVLSQKHVKYVCLTVYQYLTKFPFESAKDSKEISINRKFHY